MKYAVIKLSGSQLFVREGEEIVVNKLPFKEGEKIEVEEVLLKVDDDEVVVGKPLVAKAKVSLSVTKHFKGEKVRVAKFKAKTGYRRVTGFRSQLTSLEVEKIV